MEKRWLLFLLLASGLLFLNAWIMSLVAPPPPPVAEGDLDPEKKREEAADGDAQPGDLQKPPNADKPADADKPAVEKPAEPPAVAQEPKQQFPPRHVTLGSVDPQGKYRMAVTLTNRGAAVEAIELASANMRDLEEKGGYVGYLAPVADADAGGVRISAVADGAPAHKAGLKPGDVITAIGPIQTRLAQDLHDVLRQHKPGDTITLQFSRNGEPQPPANAVLAHFPQKVVRPEGNDPLSLLFTFAEINNERIPKDPGLQYRDSDDGVKVTEVLPNSPAERAMLKPGDIINAVDARSVYDAAELHDMLQAVPVGTRLVLTIERNRLEMKLPLELESEIPGLALRTNNWEVLDETQEEVTFRFELPERGLEVRKHFKLAQADASGRDYHLLVDVEIRNTGTATKTVAYQLDGPTGLPIEGWWYANKVSREGWIFPGPIGVRDIAVKFQNREPLLKPCTSLIGDQDVEPWNPEGWLEYIGVDAQYFAAALVPQREKDDEIWFSSAVPIRVGPVPEDPHKRKLTNVSCRLISQVAKLEADKPLKHEFVFFAGPKKPALLEQYGLKELVYYGLFSWVAKPMLWLLELFYGWVGNYGIAIIMLTVVVRACMFPLSRKQALSAQKMQELQPEIKKIAEKYKDDPLAKQRATSELFKKHNFRPLGGCLLVFVQLPIFMGLYRSLMVCVQLRQAPLIPGLDWASNLAAPDMLFRWERFMPSFLASETGWLGPYFNVFPIITIALFLVQQKMFMPPPTDEQTALQQKMMKYMMVLMGFLFFKVPAGLCIYFIASSVWGIAERKLLPKVTHAGPEKKTATAGTSESRPASPVHTNGSPRGKERAKRKR